MLFENSRIWEVKTGIRENSCSNPARNGGDLDQGGSSGGEESDQVLDILEYKLKLTLPMDLIHSTLKRSQGQLNVFGMIECKDGIAIN